jgi:protein-S-isoprenylcysteine O-methyltransferase Ste14
MMPSKINEILPPSYLLASIVALVLLHFVMPVSEVAPYPWNLLGLVPLSFGAFLNISADAALKQHQTTVKPFEKSNALVTTGVFSISRHPMYLGMVCIIFGVSVLLGSLTPLFVVPTFAVVLERKFVKTEEAMLEEQFGIEWRNYKARVHKWL